MWRSIGARPDYSYASTPQHRLVAGSDRVDERLLRSHAGMSDDQVGGGEDWLRPATRTATPGSALHVEGNFLRRDGRGESFEDIS